MIVREEKTSDHRSASNWLARFSIFGKSVFYGAEIVDFSDRGMQLRTKVPLKTGAVLVVKAIPPSSDARYLSGSDRPPNRAMGIGEVEWCERSSGYGRETYVVGLIFHGA